MFVVGTYTAVFGLALASSVLATRISIINQCSKTIEVYDNTELKPIEKDTRIIFPDANSPSFMWRVGKDPHATLAEFSVIDHLVWYDISIIPPGTDNCASFKDCQELSVKKAKANGDRKTTGFNVPMAILPNVTDPAKNCKGVYCFVNGCEDAYLYPADDLKTRVCPKETSFNVVFCPGHIESASALESASVKHAKSSFILPDLKSSFTYKGKHAGNTTGSYYMVTNMSSKSCERQRVDVTSPVGPLSEELSMVFRGPMVIDNIAVYSGSDWQLVSWYDREEHNLSNMVFMNNHNIDYSGNHGPQSFASPEGNSSATAPQIFDGVLDDASNPSIKYGGPGISTGVEVNIMTNRLCGQGEGPDCRGFWTPNTSYHGWGGGKKLFATKVTMFDNGTRPNQPAIWLLNAQILHVGQYSQCNCRGWGAKGGCGELDVAEVIETNQDRDRVSTHYYYHDDGTGYDNFAPRPTTAPTVYLTLIDDTPPGTVKIIEVNDFDFSAQNLSAAQVQRWLE